MDKKGFLFTFDAIIALISVFIVIMAVSSADQGGLILPSQQVRLSQQAQDTLDLMAQYRNSDITILEEIALILMTNNNNGTGITEAGKIASAFLDKNLPGVNYQLVEINQLNGTIITSKGNMQNAGNVAVGSRNHGNYCFKLFVWDSN